MDTQEQPTTPANEIIQSDMALPKIQEGQSEAEQGALAGEPADKEADCPVQEPEPASERPDGADSTEADIPIEPPPSDKKPFEEQSEALISKADELAAQLDSVQGGVAALQKAVAGFYTQTTDSMHKELEKFRKGLVRKLEQELFGDLIEIYDAVDKAVAQIAKDSAKAPALLEGLRDQIDAALFNRGVERREADPGEKFDARRHHAVRPDVPTGDANLDGMVAATVKPGFDDTDESFKDLRGGCMKLRPIHVRLYKFDPALASPEPEETTGTQETEQTPESVESTVSGDATHPDAGFQS